MSKKRARFEKAWRRIEAAAESGQPVEGNVIEVVKGGLAAHRPRRARLPAASLVDIRRVPNLDEYMGAKIEQRAAIELNRSRNNDVVARRAVLRKSARRCASRSSTACSPASWWRGGYANIVDFNIRGPGKGIDGLIHIFPSCRGRT